MVCGDELGGFGGGFGRIVVAAGAVRDVGDGQQRAVVGGEACGGEGRCNNQPNSGGGLAGRLGGAICVVGRSNRWGVGRAMEVVPLTGMEISLRIKFMFVAVGVFTHVTESVTSYLYFVWLTLLTISNKLKSKGRIKDLV